MHSASDRTPQYWCNNTVCLVRK